MRDVITRARFLATRDGYRFCLEHRPAATEPVGGVVFLHPFAEEMNKSRRAVAVGARALADRGLLVVQMDCKGCGDSSGDFGDASWHDWCDDTRLAVAQLPRDRPCWIWGLRAGALLASGAFDTRPDANLLLWQPVFSGQQHLNQFLRLKSASSIVGKNEGGATQDLKKELSAGRAVEVAGYSIAPALAEGLGMADLGFGGRIGGRIVLLEVSGEADATLSLPAQKRIETWRAAGIETHAEVVSGLPFWQTVEIEVNETLVTRSVACVGTP